MCDSLAAFLGSTDDLYLAWYEGIGSPGVAESEGALHLWLRLRERMKVIRELGLAIHPDAPWYWMLEDNNEK